MKVLFKNTSYFIKEIVTIIKLDFVSNILSLISLAFIFLILSLIISGGWISSFMISEVESEAEISVYYIENIEEEQLIHILDEINKIEGVNEVVPIDKLEAEKKMTEILGNESRILELFDHNPFSPYIDVKIELEEADMITSKIEELENVELVRDNKEILDRLVKVSKIVNILGILIVAAVSIATMIITSHIIRQGIYNNREQINTLRLLGAPEYFITLPFVLEGLLMAVLAGLLSMGMNISINNYIYSQVSTSLPFIILPSKNQLVGNVGLIIVILSLILGVLGSIIGLRATKNKVG